MSAVERTRISSALIMHITAATMHHRLYCSHRPLMIYQSCNPRLMIRHVMIPMTPHQICRSWCRLGPMISMFHWSWACRTFFPSLLTILMIHQWLPRRMFSQSSTCGHKDHPPRRCSWSRQHHNHHHRHHPRHRRHHHRRRQHHRCHRHRLHERAS